MGRKSSAGADSGPRRRAVATQRRDDETDGDRQLQQREKQREKASQSKRARKRASEGDTAWDALLHRSTWVGHAVLLAATFAAYYPSLSGGYIWDDRIFLRSPQIATFGGIYAIWFKPGTIESEVHFRPVVYTSFWLEHKLWGFDDPTPFRVTNVLLHFANACLARYILVRRLGQSEMAAWISAFVFALHPVRVESVAWIIERRDTLSGLFYLLALMVHPNVYPDGYGPQEGTEHWNACLGALALYVLGVLTNSIVVTLPITLLIVPWMLRGKIRTRELLDTLPFFCIGLVLALFNMSLDTLWNVSFGNTLVERVLIGSRAVCFYLYKLIWPVNLVMIYPRWDVSEDPPWVWWSCFAALSVVLIGLWAARRTQIGRGPLSALLFFGAMLSPTLGLIAYGYLHYSFVADQFQYLAGIGPVAVLAAAFGTTLSRRRIERTRHVAAAAMCLMLVSLAMLTNQHCRHFLNDESFFGHVVDQNPESFHGWFHLGMDLQGQGDFDRAANFFGKAAMHIRDDIPEHIRQQQELEVHTRHGIVLSKLKKYDESVAELEKALEVDPHHKTALNILGNVHSNAGRREEAVQYFRRVVEADPRYAIAWGNLGAELARMRQYEEAMAPLGKAVALNPSLVNPKVNLGVVMFSLGKVQESVVVFQSILQQDPEHRVAGEMLDKALSRLKESKSAE